MPGPDARLAEEYRGAGGLALDQNGQHGQNRRRDRESDRGSEQVNTTLECAVEELVDHEFVDAEHGDPPDGLQPETGDEDLEHGGNDLQFDIGMLAERHQAGKFGTRQVEARGNQDIDTMTLQQRR